MARFALAAGWPTQQRSPEFHGIHVYDSGHRFQVRPAAGIMNGFPVVLFGWSVLSVIWGILAIVLVCLARRRPAAPSIVHPPLLTVFKPLPPIADESSRTALTGALESFVLQLDDSVELLLGVPEEQHPLWQPILADWSRRYPAARLRICVQPTPRQRANPKIAWLEVLAPRAAGEFWLWSDADITAPPGLLTRLRGEFAAAKTAGAITAPYCIRTVETGPALVDALFVNGEFLPGALLLSRLGPVRFSFGAAVLFRAEDFAARVSWTELGDCLADDYLLGQRLAPVVISAELVETCALQSRYPDALRHLYRWQKTIRWCRPGSFAALILVLPLFGWLARCALTPGDAGAWAGLGAQYLFELVVTAVLLAALKVRVPGRDRWVVLAWPWLRLGGWLAAWLPLRVIWADPEQPWRSLRQS